MAARYWVGGTNSWNGTAGTKWALTDGGAGGQPIPGPLDTVFFTALSGAVTVTWFGASTTVVSINSTGFTGTHATNGQNKTLNGTGTVWTSPAGCTITGAPTLTVNSTGATAITVICNHASPSATNAPNFNFTSGTYALTCSGNGWRNITFTGFAGSITGGTNPTSYGNITLSTGGTFTAHGPTMAATGTFTSLGKTIAGITVNAVGGTITLADAMTASNITTLTAGTLALAGFTLSTSIFSSSNSNTRAITFGAGNIALTSTAAAATVLSMATATNFTFTGTGGFTRNQAATATVVFGTTGGTISNAPNLTVDAGASALTITSFSWFKNLSFTGSTCTVSNAVNMAGDLTLASGGTYTNLSPRFLVSTTFASLGKTLYSTTVNGAGITVTLADALTISTGATFTLTQGTIDLAGFTLSANRLESSNSNVRSINFGTDGSIVLTTGVANELVLMNTATNFTKSGTGGITLPGTLSIASYNFGTFGGATSSNVMDLTVSISSAGQLDFPSGSHVRSINCTGGLAFLNTISGTTNLYGNLTLASGGTYTTFSSTFLASGTITSAGKTLGNTTINGSGITATLADALTLGSTRTLTLTEGTFTAANFNVTTGSFSSSNSNTRTLNMGSGTWTISGSGATAWNTATTTGMTLNASTSTITMTSGLSKTFAGGGLTYYNLNMGSTGSSTLTISGSNTFNNITNTLAGASLIFTVGTTQTVSNFDFAGTGATAGTRATINSSSTGSQFTLSKASGTVNAQFLSIRDSNATGGANWYATNSTNVSNNTGWIFNNPNGMFEMFM